MASEVLGFNEPLWKTVLRKAGQKTARTLWPVIPYKLYVETGILSLAFTRICNARCVFCPIDLIPKQELRHMSDEVFQRVLDGIPNTHFRRVHLSPDVGEPLLAPGFLDKVHALRRVGIESIEVTTNGTFLDRVGIDEMLAEKGPDEINISFPGFDEEMYQRVYRTKKYQQTRDNILTLLRVNAKLPKRKRVQLWLRGDKPIEEAMAAPEMQEVKELAHAISYMTKVDSWLDMISQDRLTGELTVDKERKPLTHMPCVLIFDIKVYPKGEINLCSCRNVLNDPDLCVGNIHDISLSDALTRIPEVANRWSKGHIPASCQKCLMYNDPSVAFLGRLNTKLRDIRAGL